MLSMLETRKKKEHIVKIIYIKKRSKIKDLFPEKVISFNRGKLSGSE